jgi:LysR family transcriptional regulator, regulator for bpeEF and oprC
MDRLQAMKIFTLVVEANSFSRAACTLGVSRASVTVAIQCLEAHLKVRLLQRTTRRLNLTPNGAAYYERCVRVLAEIDDIENCLKVPEGSIACTCPVHPGGRL